MVHERGYDVFILDKNIGSERRYYFYTLRSYSISKSPKIYFMKEVEHRASRMYKLSILQRVLKNVINRWILIAWFTNVLQSTH